MAKKYIDADEFKKENERLLHCDFPYLSEETLEELIDNMPAADVQEVRHGRWIVNHGVLAGDGIYGDMGECSVCGLHLRNYEWDYCPNCGAKMDGEEQE